MGGTGPSFGFVGFRGVLSPVTLLQVVLGWRGSFPRPCRWTAAGFVTDWDMVTVRLPPVGG